MVNEVDVLPFNLRNMRTSLRVLYTMRHYGPIARGGGRSRKGGNIAPLGVDSLGGVAVAAGRDVALGRAVVSHGSNATRNLHLGPADLTGALFCGAESGTVVLYVRL